jgi:alpha-ketoglutaric semialdehyde dehydrogenase
MLLRRLSARSDIYGPPRPTIEAIAANLEGLGSDLISTAAAETALTAQRLTGERARTCDQLRQFAALLRDGWYVDAIIDTGDPLASPPRPDIRRMLIPIGPVAVFGASNFPLAFSVPGGDTASALAAGCPVVVKAHPSHPETSELCGQAISAAVRSMSLPPGTFSLVQGQENRTGQRLVEHPATAAVAFTGSEAGGRALFNLAASRPRPIPVFAEMGSLNPFIVGASALRVRSELIAEGLLSSVTLGSGQFCTKPGVVFVPSGAIGDAFIVRLKSLLAAHDQQMYLLNVQTKDALERRLAETGAIVGSEAVHTYATGQQGLWVAAALIETDTDTLRENPDLTREHFGPVALVVRYCGVQDLAAALAALGGNLTATIHAESDEESWVAALLPDIAQQVGRVIWNGFPTGVTVTAAMHHGGPYPASTSVAHTSVGWTAIQRFLRPVAFQDAPAAHLPDALQDANPLGVLRLVNGVFTADAINEPA